MVLLPGAGKLCITTQLAPLSRSGQIVKLAIQSRNGEPATVDHFKSQHSFCFVLPKRIEGVWLPQEEKIPRVGRKRGCAKADGLHTK